MVIFLHYGSLGSTCKLGGLLPGIRYWGHLDWCLIANRITVELFKNVTEHENVLFSNGFGIRMFGIRAPTVV